MMRAQVLEETALIDEEPLRFRDRPVPEPGAGEVLIRVRACGVCHTDLHIVEGEVRAPRLPLIPGHEVVGTVERSGAGTARFAPGARVGVAWLHRTCGVCEFCRRGSENLCDRARFTGFHVDGGYAEFMVAPQEFVYAIPAGWSDVAAAPLLCAGIIGYRALRLSQAAPGERLALFGFGASAHITLQIAAHRGCEVYVFTRSEEHRRLALSLGAAWAGQAGEAAPALADRAILFAPSGRLIPPALRALRKAGTLAIAVIHLDVVPEMDYALLFEERTIRTVTASTRRDGEELLAAATEAGVRVETESFALEEAGRALALVKSGRIRGAGVLLPA
ncbi:MAG TPA: zinc-dependent alcohol dehydrogenase family protein [Candidatus Polarisedimenticolia bacterium]|nr:zinc-dependent alcohol dehydrogenase family protein [Candidatus Polarisedimenticolia bacterium]